jgi:FtsP/CotA-like multicopper oxidase with cupredoxin domain
MKTKRDLEARPESGRRNFFKASLAATGAYVITTKKTEAQVLTPVLLPSPATTPWVEDLPICPPKQPVEALTPEAHGFPGEYECGRVNHQAWRAFPPQKFYEIHVKEGLHSFHPQYPVHNIWGYDGITPGPVFHNRYGTPCLVRIYNDLPANVQGPGSPEISTHLHNLHSPSESDGFPGDYYSATRNGPTLTAPGVFKDHHYINMYAGLDEFGGIGDSREALGTLWYHDHRLDFTTPNVLKGLAGFYLLFDDLDSGDEKDPNPAALRLPSGEYDIPLIFGDRRFDTGGNLYWDQLSPEGVLGDKVLVNGKIEPVLRVARRKYRFRLLDGGPTRWYEFYLVNAGNVVQTFTYIANDGNLLPAPLLNQTKVKLGVAERGDIVVDFSRYPIGTELYVVNRLRQDSTRGPKDVKAPGTRLMKIIVDRNPPEPDVSRVPSALRPLRPLDPAEIAAAPVRRFEFTRKNGLWMINDQLADVNSPRLTINKGAGEIWELVNSSGGWSHPVHIHFEEGRILSRTVNGISVPVPAHERGRKDVYPLDKDSSMRLFMRFRDFAGKYVMHCHNTVHEDHAMMLRWDIEA